MLTNEVDISKERVYNLFERSHKTELGEIQMTLKKISALSMASLVLIPTASYLLSIPANADTVQSVVTSQSSKINTTTDNHKLFDAYVSVKDNQFVLNIPQDIQLNQNEVEQVKQQISDVNSKIRTNKLIINQTTKEISSQNPTLRSSGYTYGNFWWGTRYYFRSNAAVYAMDHDLDNWSIMTGVTALWAPAVAVLGAAYFQKVKSDLDYYNNTHSKNYIDMDVNWAGVYSIYAV